VMREREALAQDGLVIVNLRVNKHGQLVEKPEMISRGFVFVRDSEELFETAQTQIASIAEKMNGSGSPEALRDKVQTKLSDFFYAETKRRPMIFALVNEVAND